MIPPVLAATYLDPECQVLLTEEQRNSQNLAPNLLLINDVCYWNNKRTACAVEKCLVAY